MLFDAEKPVEHCQEGKETQIYFEAMKAFTAVKQSGEQQTIFNDNAGAPSTHGREKREKLSDQFDTTMSQCPGSFPKSSDRASQVNRKQRIEVALLMYNSGMSLFELSWREKALQLLELALELVDVEGACYCFDSLVVGLNILNSLAHMRYVSNKLESAAKDFYRAMMVAQDLFNLVDVDCGKHSDDSICIKVALRQFCGKILTSVSKALCTIGRDYENAGMGEDAMLLYSLVVDIRSHRCFSVMDPRLSNLHSHMFYKMGKFLHNTGDDYGALQAFTCAIDLRVELKGPAHPEVASLLFDRGLLQMEVGDLSDAMESFQRCLKIRQISFGTHDLRVAETLQRIGLLQKRNGQYLDALNSFSETVRIEKLVLGHDNPAIAMSLVELARAAYVCGEFSRSLRSCEEALCLAANSTADNHRSPSEVMKLIISLHNCQEKTTTAETTFATLRAAVESTFFDQSSRERGMNQFDFHALRQNLIDSDSASESGAAAA